MYPTVYEKISKCYGKYITIMIWCTYNIQESPVNHIYKGILWMMAGSMKNPDKITLTIITDIGNETILVTKQNLVSMTIGSDVEAAMFKIEHDIA